MTRQVAERYVADATENFFDDFLSGLSRSFPLSYHAVLRQMIRKLEDLAQDGEQG
jgi:hypothetical protein